MSFAITDSNSVLDALNYVVSNLGASTGALSTNVLTVNATTNAVTVGVGGEVYSYNVQYINIRYANNATGTSGFTSIPTNSFYYGIQATADSVPTTIENPASYSWKQVGGSGFGTTNFLFYLAPGGRQITFDIAATSASQGFLQSQNGIAIDLDFITTVAANVIIANNIANGSITSTEIAANTILGYNIATNTITATNIANNTITGTKIAANTITATNIAAFTITGGKIANGTITSTEIASNTITGTNMLNATITGSKIATNTVTGTNIGVQTVTANNIANSTITGQQLIGNIVISTTGNVTANYFIGNGSQLTGLAATYSNADVANYLPTYSGNIRAVTGNIATVTTTGNLIIGPTAGNTLIQGNAHVNGGFLRTTAANSYLFNINSTTVSLGGAADRINFGNTSNSSSVINVTGIISAYGNVVAGNVLTGGYVSAAGTVTGSYFIGTPVALANLTAVAGSRAFVNNANLVAANNFGQLITSGGSNIVPVWSDGSDWYIG